MKFYTSWGRSNGYYWTLEVVILVMETQCYWFGLISFILNSKFRSMTRWFIVGFIVIALLVIYFRKDDLRTNTRKHVANYKLRYNQSELDDNQLAKKLAEHERNTAPTWYLYVLSNQWILKSGVHKVTVKNNSDRDIKDVQFKFTYYAESGTIVDTGYETAYKIFPAKSERMVELREFGHSQSEKVMAEIVDAKWAN